MVRCEIFPAIYIDGDEVELPTSPRDGYQYSRDELQYAWTIRNSANPSSKWISGPDSLWFCNWFVEQDTGKVHSEEWYRRSGEHDQNARSTDGSLLVFTIAQRQLTSLILADEAEFSAIDEADIDVDKPFTQSLTQALNHNAKLSGVAEEVIYCGEFVDGDQVPEPTSPADSHAYTYAECQFFICWRWTALGSTYTQPDKSLGQLGPFKASIDGTGNITIEVNFVGDDGNTNPAAGFGRVAVFAFCTRSAVPATAPLADDFTEQTYSTFFPGKPLKASTVLAIKKNADEALFTPEFFGPTDYGNGDTVPLPVSTRDGYTYARAELQYLWWWADTTNQTGEHLRLPLFEGQINDANGAVTLKTYRLPPGGPITDDNNTLCLITVLVVATRQAEHDALDNTPGDTNDPPDMGGTIPGTGNKGFYVNGVGA
jgi:hypothetical protein